MNPTRNEPKPDSTWPQVNIRFTTWPYAEVVAAEHLAPILGDAETTSLIRTWFFTRKYPYWRLRVQPMGQDREADAVAYLHQCLDELVREDMIDSWVKGIYEPEAHTFGGPAAMATAHQLFHHDSREILHLANHRPRPASRTGGRRREIAVLLATTLLRSAGQDWYEQGDIWAQIAEHRTLPENIPPERLAGLQPAVRRLMTVDADSLTGGGKPLAGLAGRVGAFTAAGAELADHNNSGTLTRGIRAVLTHHVLFAWNRHGLPHDIQAALAHAAQAVVFDD